jgi:hypothetical protein
MVLLTSIAAAFPRFIGTSIPQIIDLLENDDSYIRYASVDVLLKLSVQGM